MCNRAWALGAVLVLLVLPATSRGAVLVGDPGVFGLANFDVNELGGGANLTSFWNPSGGSPNVDSGYGRFILVSDLGANPGSPVGHALAPFDAGMSNFLTPVAAGAAVTLTTADTMHSTFTLPAFPGVSVSLVQVAAGSKLTQTYTFTNASAASGGVDRTLTIASFTDVDMQFGSSFVANLGVFDPAHPQEISVTNEAKSHFGTIGLFGGADFTFDGFRAYHRPAQAGGGLHDSSALAAALGIPTDRFGFRVEEILSGASFPVASTLDDANGDGVSDTLGDMGISTQGTLFLAAGATRSITATLEFTFPLPAPEPSGTVFLAAGVAAVVARRRRA